MHILDNCFIVYYFLYMHRHLTIMQFCTQAEIPELLQWLLQLVLVSILGICVLFRIKIQSFLENNILRSGATFCRYLDFSSFELKIYIYHYCWYTEIQYTVCYLFQMHFANCKKVFFRPLVQVIQHE